jgi:phage terminase small subunit
MPLTPKQQRFVDEYLLDLNATQAAIRAGYSARTAASIGEENLRKPDIAAAVQAAQAERATRTAVTQDYVVANLAEIERCMQRAPVMVRRGREMVPLEDDEGREVWQFDARGATGALALIGKHLGMFVDRHDVTATITDRPARLTTPERDARLREILRDGRN